MIYSNEKMIEMTLINAIKRTKTITLKKEDVITRLRSEWNGKKIGATRSLDRMRSINIQRELAKKIILPFNIVATNYSRANQCRIELDEKEETIFLPISRGSYSQIPWLNRQTTGKNKGKMTSGVKSQVAIANSLICQRRKSDQHEFEIFCTDIKAKGAISLDHHIPQKTLFIWFLKGLIEKNQFQDPKNMGLMRSKENTSKGSRPQADNLYSKYRTISKEQLVFAKKLHNTFLNSKEGREMTQIKKKSGKKYVSFYKAIHTMNWYSLHRIVNSKFYQNTKDLSSLCISDTYLKQMIEVFHPDLIDEMYIERNGIMVRYM